MSQRSDGKGWLVQEIVAGCVQRWSVMAEFLLAGGGGGGKVSTFVLLGPSSDWMRPTHTMSYSESADKTANLIQKTPSQKHPE